jgi:hypothetical protein
VKAREIIEAFGVPVVEISELPDGDTPLEIGESPDSAAEIRLVENEPVVWWLSCMRSWEDTFADVLHEVLHVVAGPDTLGDDGPVMAIQAELLSLLDDPTERATARANLADFYFSWMDPDTGMGINEVSDNDAVFLSPEWEGMRRDAEAAGLLVQRGGQWVPVFGGGVHPSWKDWIAARAGSTMSRLV